MTMNATQAMKMNIIFWNSPMPNSEKVKRDHRGHGDIAADDHQRREEGVDAAKAAAQDAQGNSHQRRQAESQHDSLQADAPCCASARA